MNLLAALEQLSSLDFSPIRAEANRCLQACDRFSTCEACVRACPTDALHLNGSIQINVEACVACGQCSHVCPTGVFDTNDGAAELLDLVPRLKEARAIELACARHPSPELGPLDADAVIRIDGCLAALGPSVYLTLLVSCVDHIVARLDACTACPIGGAQPKIEQTLEATRKILNALSETDRVRCLTERQGEGWTRRPLYARKPQITRRDLFRRTLGQGQQRAARALALDTSPDSPETFAKQGPPLERRRLLDALRRLSPVDVTARPHASLDGLPFARMSADEMCTACSACARICPTGALQFVGGEDDTYQLSLSTGACTDCGACLHVCAPGALHRDTPSLADLIQTNPAVLRTGTLRRCQKCNARFAGAPDSTLCPVCDFRRKNPFGSRLPPGFDRRNPAVGEHRSHHDDSART